MITTVKFSMGPYAPGEEDRFKTDVLKAREKHNVLGLTNFRIETEETEPGFPDVLMLGSSDYLLTEFKVSDENGVITFKKSQPLFYKKHPDLRITIVAWDMPGNRMVSISPDEIVSAKTLRFKIPRGDKK